MAYFFDSRTTIQEGGEVNATDNKVVSGKTVYDAIFDIVYPIGSVYISVNNVSPQTFLGGTWVSIGSGKTLIGVDTNDSDFNTVEKTGGSKTKTLITDNLPAHAHSVGENYIHSQNNGITNGDFINYAASSSLGGWGIAGTTNNKGTSRLVIPAHNTNNTGSGTAFNVVNPYFTVYMWKRTA